jgi:putative ABC transport system permease protein
VPAAAWRTVHTDPVVFVDRSLLIALSAAVGDSLRLGTRLFRIAGTLGNIPGDAGIASVIGPRVYVSDRWMASTGLLAFGSRAQYDAVLQLPAAMTTPKASAAFAKALAAVTSKKRSVTSTAG